MQASHLESPFRRVSPGQRHIRPMKRIWRICEKMKYPINVPDIFTIRSVTSVVALVSRQKI